MKRILTFLWSCRRPIAYWFFATILATISVFFGDTLTLVVLSVTLSSVALIILFDHWRNRSKERWNQKVLFDKNKPMNIKHWLTDAIH